MDDLSKKLGDLLSSPDAMQKIQSAMAALGMDGGSDGDEPDSAAEEPAEDGGFDPEMLSGLLASLGGGAPKEKPKSGGPRMALPPPDAHGDGLDLTAIAKLAPVLGNMHKDDQNTILLKALRPYLHGDREKRLDQAIKILRFMKVMPLLQDRGLF